MAAFSDYLEAQLLNHIFRADSFTKPANVSVVLTGEVAQDNDTGSTLPELPSGIDNGGNFTTTGYTRLSLGSPSSDGTTVWGDAGVDATTAFVVDNYDTPNASGYFYPLYLSEAAAVAADNGNPQTATSFTFSEEHPGTTFYGPSNIVTSGSATNDTTYELYEGNGFIKNNNQLIFGTALSDWGWVSGIAFVDSNVYGQGNVLMYSELTNPRYVYTGDNIKFDAKSLEISIS